MKLREFMANSLPRMRGRKKKEGNANNSSSSNSSNSNGSSETTAADSGSTAASTAASPAKHGKHLKVASTKPTAVDSAVKSSPAATPAKTQGSSHGNWFQFHESRFAFLERLVGKESPVKRLFDHGGSKDHKPSSGAGRSRSPHHSTPTVPEPRAQLHRSPSPLIEREGRWPGKAEDRRRQSYSTSSADRGCSGLYDSVEVIERYAGLPQKCCPCPPGGLPCLCPESGLVCGGSCPSQRRYRLTEPDVDAASLYSQGCGNSYAESVTSYDSTPGSQRGPRSRSRIRTNPWLPSPRPSPYSVRSFSSPCASSRSPSPSPSSSFSPPSFPTAPGQRTPASASRDVAREPHPLQRHHYRRHRRHHSDVVTSELEPRELTSETPLTDTEQYYSTLDSGIGETSTSPDEKDKERGSSQLKPAATASTKKHFVKRRSSDRESHFFAQLKGFSFFSGAGSTPLPSPKFRPKLRPKVTKSSHQSTPSSSSSARGIVVNRDSKFWDSDSSVSPPCPAKNYQASARSPGRHSWLSSRESEHFWNYEDNNNNLGNNNNDSSVHNYNTQSHGSTERIQKKETLGLFSSRKFFQKDITVPAELSRREAFEDFQASSPALSPCCEDIGVITSNIEQLAHNLSYEYEDELNVSFRSSDPSDTRFQTGKYTYKSASLSDNKESFVSENCGNDLSKNLNYFPDTGISSFLNSFDKVKCPVKEEKISTLGHDLILTNLKTKTSMVDVCLQTDFVDEDEEENSSSDWLPSTESGSDWLTPSNGSGSDWPISGGSGFDWPSGEGSGCATEEDVDCSGKAEQEEEVTNVAEGGKVWVVPDVMQDSTDTGYSSLSRDGRVVNNTNNNTSTDIDSTDSATEKSDSNSRSGSVASNKKLRPESSTTELIKIMNPTKPDPGKNSGHSPENPLCHRSEVAALSATGSSIFDHFRPSSVRSSSDSFENAVEDYRQGKELISCTQNLDTEGKKCLVKVRHHHYGLKKGAKAERNESQKAAENRGITIESVPCSLFYGRCSKCDSDHGRGLDDTLWASSEFENEIFSCDSSGAIPYPYDVTRFADVSIPFEKREGLGSVSPCCSRSSRTTCSRRFEHLSQNSPISKEMAFLPRSSTPFCDNVYEDHSKEHDEKADDHDDDDDDEEFCFCSSPKDSMTSSVIYTGETKNSMTSSVVYTDQPKDETIKSSSSFFRRFSKKNRQEAALSSLLTSRSCAEKEKSDKKSERAIPHSRSRGGSEDLSPGDNTPIHISSPKRPTQLETLTLHQSCKPVNGPREAAVIQRSGGTSERMTKEPSKKSAAAASRDSNLSVDNRHPTYIESMSNGQSGRRREDYCLSKTTSGKYVSNSSMDYDSDLEVSREDGALRSLEASQAPRLRRRRRSLGDVVSSLKDQVLYLRHDGKHVTGAVQHKIREAQEEEHLRQQHRMRFQRLLDVHRKRVLLETLQDLRQRLLSQSARLQASYSSVLDMRKRQM